MTSISNEIRQAIEQAGDAPMQLTAPDTNASYVIIRAAVYERMRAPCDNLDIRNFYPVMNEVAAREAWDNSALDIYAARNHDRSPGIRKSSLTSQQDPF